MNRELVPILMEMLLKHLKTGAKPPAGFLYKGNEYVITLCWQNATGNTIAGLIARTKHGDKFAAIVDFDYD